MACKNLQAKYNIYLVSTSKYSYLVSVERMVIPYQAVTSFDGKEVAMFVEHVGHMDGFS